MSEAAADRLEERITPLIQSASPQDFTLQATADEVTSLLVRMLADRPGQSPVEDPRVCFSPSRVYVAGRFATVLPFEFEGVVVAVPHLVDGRLSIEVAAAHVGSLAVSSAFLRSSSRTISETLAEWLPDVSFHEIRVTDGSIVVRGHRGR